MKNYSITLYLASGQTVNENLKIENEEDLKISKDGVAQMIYDSDSAKGCKMQLLNGSTYINVIGIKWND